ncbi:MAG: hypothetical protein L3K08_07305 [Thermoplasmata archaeon]|nr:hypothetical protein [Thermoplasmata archaeon]
MAQTPPRSGDRFRFHETITLGQGEGNRSGYTEDQFINGSYAVESVGPDGSASVAWAIKGVYVDSLQTDQSFADGGNFSFSPSTYRYVSGSDNQSEFAGPFVWFFVNGSLPVGASLHLQNSSFSVVSTDAPFPMPSSPTGYVQTLFAEGTGTYERNDYRGDFTAAYDWKVYFDPVSGYIVGYAYTEQDSDVNGNGFTWTDTLAVTDTSYSLRSSPPPAPAGSPHPGIATPLLVVGGLGGFAVLGLLFLRFQRRRSRRAAASPKSESPDSPPSNSAPSMDGPAPIDRPSDGSRGFPQG